MEESRGNPCLPKKLRGIFFLSMVILTWVGSSILIQMILDSKHSQFAKPLFLTYFCCSFFTLYLVPLLFRCLVLKLQAQGTSSEDAASIDATSTDFERRGQEAQVVSRGVLARQQLDALKATVRKTYPLSLTFCLVWFFANYFYNYGLMYASVTTSVVLSNTSPAIVYMLNLSCLVPAAVRQKCDWLCILMILVSLSGFVIIAIQDKRGTTDTSEKPMLGDALSFMSAICFSIYGTYLKIKVPESEEASFKFSYFLGFVGLSNVVLLLLLFVIFDATGFETFEWPSQESLVLLSVNAFFGSFLSDYCWGKSVLLLGPFVTTLGTTLTFPLSAFFDSVVMGAKFDSLYALGSVMILTAVGVIMSVEFKKKKKVSKQQKQQLEYAEQLIDPSEARISLKGTD